MTADSLGETNTRPWLSIASLFVWETPFYRYHRGGYHWVEIDMTLKSCFLAVGCRDCWAALLDLMSYSYNIQYNGWPSIC